MIKNIFSFLFFALLTHICTAQYNLPQNMIWAMDRNSGIDFRPPQPVTFQTNLAAQFSNSHEAAVTITGETGLSFYTNGTTVWNASDQVMLHGLRINGPGNNSESSTQGALIVPDPSQTKFTRFYLFSLNSIDQPGKLFCNVINMSLDNGLGDVDTTFYLHHIAIDTGLSEKMIAIRGCDNNIWVVVHSKTGTIFKAYEVTPTGINPVPVISNCGAVMMYPAWFEGIGMIKSSPDGTRILNCNLNRLEVARFNIVNGVVSNNEVLDTVTALGYYGGEFSPDGTKVYAKGYGSTQINQFDLNAASPSGTKTLVGAGASGLTGLQLGPDHKIYFSSGISHNTSTGARYMGRINAPDNPAISCGFQDSVTTLTFPNSISGGPRGNFQNTFVLPGQGLNVVITYNNNILSTTNVFTTYQWYKAGIPITGANGQNCMATGNAWYSVKVTGAYGCSDSAAYEVTGGTGTSLQDIENLKQYITAYPNPADNNILIKSPLPVNITLHDISGKLIRAAKSKTEMNVGNIAEGLYFLRITDSKNNFIKVEKVSVQHHSQ